MPHPSEQSSWTSVKNGLSKITQIPGKLFNLVGKYVPAVAKLTAMMGSAAFTGDHVARLALGSENGLQTPLGTTAAIALVTGSGTANYVIRFRNMTRGVKRPVSPPPSQETPAFNVHNATWLTPDNTINNHPPGYLAVNAFAIMYMITSSGASILAAYSLSSLVASIAHSPFDPKCSEEQSPDPVLWTVFNLAVLLVISSARSFYLYNLQRLRTYYDTFITNEEYKNVSWRSHLETLVGVLNSTVSIFFSNRQMLNTLQADVLCHVGVDSIPVEATESVMYTGAIVNFVISYMMTLPAVHFRKTSHSHDINKVLAELPTFKKIDKPIRFALFIDSLNVALSSFIGTYSLPETIKSEKAYLEWSAKGIGMSVAGLVAALFAGFNQYALDFESYVKEVEASLQDKISSEQQSTLEGITVLAEDEKKQPLLSDSSRSDSSLSSSSSFAEGEGLPHGISMQVTPDIRSNPMAIPAPSRAGLFARHEDRNTDTDYALLPSGKSP